MTGHANIPDEVREALTNRFGELKGFKAASGGCINHGGTLECAKGRYFIKWNELKRFPGMFRAEKQGLQLLAAGDCLRIPRVIDVFLLEDKQILVLEQVDSGRRNAHYDEKLARGLACIHRRTRETYGLDHDNYMGALPQYNKSTKTLKDFVVCQRLEPQVRLARDSGRLAAVDQDRFEQLYLKLDNLLYEEKPSLVHGDLWGGNVITDEAGDPVLIDPAVAYGHREMDLAMTTLFGGFGEEFYAVYQESYPLPPGQPERRDLYTLYPLLIHVNLFGGGYASQVRQILKQFTD